MKIKSSSIYILMFTTLCVVESIRVDVAGALVKPFFVLVFISIIGLVLLKFNNNLIMPKTFKYITLWQLSFFIPVIAGTVISYPDLGVVFGGQIILTVLLLYMFNYFIKRPSSLLVYSKSLTVLSIFISLLGLIQLAAFYAFDINIGVAHFDMLGFPRPKSVFSEPDWYGLFAGYATINNYFQIMSTNPGMKNKFPAWISLALNICSLLLSSARTAVFGLVCVGMIYYFYSGKNLMAKIWNIALLSLATVIIVSVIGLVAPENISSRFNPFKTTINDSGALQTRLNTMYLTIMHIKEHPLAGNGAGSLNKLTKDDSVMEMFVKMGHGSGMNDGRGGSNLILTSIFDAGVFSLIVILIFFFKLCVSPLQILSRLKHVRSHSNMTFAFAIFGLMFFLIESMSTNIVRYSLVWLHMSFLMAAIHLAPRYVQNNDVNVLT